MTGDRDDPGYDSEDARASRRENRNWGCGADLIGCGVDLTVLLIFVPAAIWLL